MTSYQATDTQLTLIDWLAQQDARARGETFSEALDKSRLCRQAHQVVKAMESGGWHSLQELNEHVPGLQTSISARIREIRNFLHETSRGTIERKRHETIKGLHLYRMVLKC